MSFAKRLLRWFEGVQGICRSVLGINLIDEKKAAMRREICNHCEHAKPCGRSKRGKCRCDICGCGIYHKTRLEKSRCPLDYW